MPTPVPKAFQRRLFAKHLIVIALLALGVRVAGAVVMGSGFSPSTWEYEEITQNMLRTGQFVMHYREYGDYYALLAPGYPYLSYFVYQVFGTSHKLMLVLQYGLSLVLCASVYLLSWRLFFRQWAAYLAAALVAVHPGIAVYGATKLHNFNLYVPLFYAALCLMVWCHQRGTWAWFCGLGLVGGLAVLGRATVLPILLIWLVVVCVRGQMGNWRRRLGLASLALGIILAVNTPWALRNYRVFDRFVFSQTNGWEQFWVGNNLHATGTHYTQKGVLILRLKPKEMQAELMASETEIGDAEIFKRYTLAYVRNNPGHFLKGLLSKAWRFWWFHPQTGIHYPWLALVVYKLVYLAILFLTIEGLLICHKQKLWRVELLYPFLLVVALAALHTLAFGEMRHRWAVEPVMLLFGGLALASRLKAVLPDEFEGSTLPAGEQP